MGFLENSIFGLVGPVSYLRVSSVLFSLGVFAVVTRRNAVAVLMGVELILNAAALNFASFSHFSSGDIAGQVVSIFVIVLAAVEATVALAIILSIYGKSRTINVDEASLLKE